MAVSCRSINTLPASVAQFLRFFEALANIPFGERDEPQACPRANSVALYGVGTWCDLHAVEDLTRRPQHPQMNCRKTPPERMRKRTMPTSVETGTPSFR